MRLICGILRLDGSTASDIELNAMAAAMTAPGLSPHVATRLDGPMGLAVLDFTGAATKPVQLGEWIVAADMRLDRPVGADEAIFVDALQQGGPDFPDSVDGDFAVALWQRDTATLWLGRDFIGARPLASTCRPGKWFAFASLPKGLHGADLAPATVDRVAQGVRLRQSFFRGSDSGFAEIAYLPAGHSLRIRPGDASPPPPHRAYRPDPGRVGCWSGTQEEAADVLRRLLQDAVASRIPRAGPVACHLSGGLDSSAITVLAAREGRRRGQPVLALSMTTEQPLGPADLDERPLIAAVLAQEPDVAHFVAHDGLRMPGEAEDPDWPGSLVDGYDDRMMARAAAFGAGRLLSGVGGDEGATYNGANLYVRLLRQGNLRTLMRELRARARREEMPLAKALRDRLILPLLPRIVRDRLVRRTSAMHPTTGIPRYLHPDMREKVLERSMPPILQANTPHERTTAFADHHIPSRCAYYAIMGARHGVAVSFPLLDRRVVDFMLSLPVRMFLSDGYGRQPFRRAMRGILPDRVRLARNKVGLFDERFLGYALRKADLLARAGELRTASPEAAAMFDLDAIAAGLALLPDAEAIARSPSAREALAEGVPPWLPLMAVECLIAATRLHAPPGARPG
ncbi:MULTISPECIES: asparagine synthase-related protein [unclassified Sphingomonas]|uniref:asparagine synthase-related protein n=1 Tax=unclassified Sphingomonas TaxID=196159 RepID=UPI0007014B39|nr:MULTISPECIES: asparagine synthase-related protein [unclassified Sphingomonas]KQX22681.1 hypothetical protein ASD17_05165 [Sphingomonas sp. Root1294]KQY67839.1 hypothetical protein ASD39_07960 [Sphingomonas sp. Root50]KRB88763.1 hypothetical protein ASE22_20310 [Sphingomonas sp. Root720]